MLACVRANTAAAAVQYTVMAQSLNMQWQCRALMITAVTAVYTGGTLGAELRQYTTTSCCVLGVYYCGRRYCCTTSNMFSAAVVVYQAGGCFGVSTAVMTRLLLMLFMWSCSESKWLVGVWWCGGCVPEEEVGMHGCCRLYIHIYIHSAITFQ